jgi:hypothetical protein
VGKEAPNIIREPKKGADSPVVYMSSHTVDVKATQDVPNIRRPLDLFF